MYILVKETDVRNEEILKMYHETMPDGRLILPISDLRMLGSIAECQIVASAKELKELIKKNAQEVAESTDEVAGDGTAMPEEQTGVDQPEETETSENITEQPEETAESENKIEEPITEEE